MEGSDCQNPCANPTVARPDSFTKAVHKTIMLEATVHSLRHGNPGPKMERGPTNAMQGPSSQQMQGPSSQQKALPQSRWRHPPSSLWTASGWTWMQWVFWLHCGLCCSCPGTRHTPHSFNALDPCADIFRSL
eukprot:1331304-Amphidinium_carterae.1